MKSKRFRKILAILLCVTNIVSFSMPAVASEGVAVVSEDSAENIALNKTAVSSSVEGGTSHTADRVIDGNTTSTRWASSVNNAPHWIYVDLGETSSIKAVRLYWETRKATNYEIQIADTLSDPMTDADWETVKTITQRPVAKKDTIVLDETVTARYVRLYISAFDSLNPDDNITWNNISVYEMEVYDGEPVKTAEDYLNEIVVSQPSAGDTRLSVSIPAAEGYTIAYNGTDYEQIIDEDLNIYQPIVDSTVKASFKCTNDSTGEYHFREVAVTVPGTYTPAEGDNEAPEVIPELREWKGSTGTFAPTNSSRIVIASSNLQETAEAFAEDYEEITGKSITVVTGTESSIATGDFYFALTTDTSKGLDEEGYIMEIADAVKVEAETTTGAFWATRTILQSLKLTNGIPKGITRDYPLYEVRGVILDVGRKTFTMDYLQQMMKQMSWYKLNDFQIHLNDNLIFLETYSDNGLNPMEAYSGFRLESDIKEGGDSGIQNPNAEDGSNFIYQADLTNTDVYYTKDEFRDFIQDSRVYGVDIVPEIDTPAHSLALTKVIPELRVGTNGRQNDHLDLVSQYDECLAFVQNIFGEYMTEEDPVFDENTTIQVGADEYTASAEKFCRFSEDMIEFVQSSGRTARIWGSHSTLQSTNYPVLGTTEYGSVQMNLWNNGWAEIGAMYKRGFDLINCNDNTYYIVPDANYYFDYLNENTVYNQDINTIGSVTIPAGDKQMLGGAVAVWNDNIDYMDTGISEYDVYDRLEPAIPLFAAKLWGKHDRTLSETKELRDELGDAPGTNFSYEVEHEGDEIANYPMDTMEELTAGKNASIEEVDGRNALKLNGDESYVSTEFSTVGLSNDLRIKVKRTSDSKEEQILFEGEYGTIKAVQKGTGKVGFSREGYDYSFNYTLPINRWVELEFKNEFEVMKLYVDGVLVDTLGDGDEKGEKHPVLKGTFNLTATMMIPFERIGSKENAFIGYVDDIRLGVNKTYNSTMELDRAVILANSLMQENENTQLSTLLDQADTIFAKYAPTATEISNLTSKITKITDDMEYDLADYSNVDVYVNLVDKLDLTIFTSKSVESLNTALESIDRTLPASMQSVVDGYEQTLAAAIKDLEEKEAADIRYVDNSTITITASSYQDASSAPGKAIDGDESTIWHSQWSVTTMPHWIDLEMSEPTAIDAVTYVPRSGGGNGTLTSYIIKVSDDGVNYTDHKTGTLADNGQTKIIEFDAVTTKHIRVHYVEARSNNGSAAEIKLHKASIVADTEGLADLVEEYKTITKEGFTDEAWNALQAKIQEAEALLAQSNPDANAVAVMKRELIVKATDVTKFCSVHDFGEWEEVIEATCGEDGEENRICSQCGKIEKNILEKTGDHQWDEGEITIPATADTDGEMTYSCTVCDETKTEVILATGKEDSEGTSGGNSGEDSEGTSGGSSGGTSTGGTTPTVTLPSVGASKVVGGASYKVLSAASKGGAVSYTKPASSASNITIPDSIQIDGISYDVTMIEANAFKNNKKLKSITIGKNIVTIGANAFFNCTGLKIVKMGAKVETIEAKAFGKCTKLKSIILPASIKTLKANIFLNCKNLKTITIQSTSLDSKSVAKNVFKSLGKGITIKVPKAKVSAYKKLFKSKGLSAKVKVKK